jgi:hypothetical protein
MTTIQITGKTYECRDWIKQFGGVWQAATKTWSMDADKFAAMRARKPIITAGCRIAGQDAPVAATEGQSVRLSAICRKCGTYCYGDCAGN